MDGAESLIWSGQMGAWVIYTFLLKLCPPDFTPFLPSTTDVDDNDNDSNDDASSGCTG